MRGLVPFLFLAILFYKAFGMTCSDVPTQTKCIQLNGCFWTTSCRGMLNPPCMPPSCYYVDSYSTAPTTGIGSPDNPVTSISQAINNLKNMTGTIIIMNYIDNVTAQVNQAHSLSGGIINIQPLFKGSLYNLDFSKIPVPGLSSIISFFKVLSPAALVVNSGILTFTLTANQYIFDNVNGNITLQNFHFVNCSASKGYLVRTTLSSSASIFTYDGGSNSNNSATHVFYGTTTIRNVQFVDVGATTFISAGGTLVIDGAQVRGGTKAATITLFNLAQDTNITIRNSIFQEGSFSVMSATGGPKTVNIVNTTFQNMTPYGSTIFYLKSVATDGKSIHTIEDCTFQNINVSSSIILAEMNGIVLNMNRVRMINIRKSTLVQEDQQYAGEWIGGICALTRNDAILSVTNSEFTNIYSHCFGIKESALSISFSNFTNNGFVQPILTKDVINSLNDKSGITWLNIKDTTGIISDGHNITLTGNRFINNSAISRYGGAIRLIGVTPSQLYAVGNEFIGNMAYYGGAIYSSNNLLSLNFSNNFFAENRAYDGGAIYKTSLEFNEKSYVPSVVLNGDSFAKNTAIRNGGAAIFDWESLSMQKTTFARCRAQNGGAIYFINLDNYFNEQYGYLQDNHFYQNSASDTGGALRLFFDFTDLNQNPLYPSVFANNTASEGSDISSEKPSYYLFSFYDVLVEHTFDGFDDLTEWVSNTTRTRFAFSLNTSNSSENLAKNRLVHKSGHEVTQIIMIEIMNSEGELLDYIRNEKVSVQLVDYVNTINDFTPYLISSPVILIFDNGKIYIKPTVQIIGEPQTTAILNFRGVLSSSNLLKDANLLLNFNITVYFQDCEVGDLFDSEAKTCDTCDAGTYSLSDPYQTTSCTKCDITKAQCLGGSKIAVLPGYWRSDATSSNILECPADGACLGGLVDEVYYAQGVCGWGYEGNLCNKCIPKYAKFGSSNECLNCRRDAVYYVKLVGFFVLKMSVVIYSIKVNLNKIILSKKAHGSNSLKLNRKLKNTDFQSNLIKIVVNFIQVSSLIVQYRFQWPDLISDILNVTNKFFPTESDGFSIDCLVALITKNNQQLLFIKLVITLFEPLGIWVTLILGYMAILKIKKEKVWGNPKLIQNITVLFVITAFIIQPSLVQATLEVFKCENFKGYENPVYYMVKDSEVQCWTPFHLLWSAGIALPFFLLWGVILPLALLRKLRATQKNLQDPEVYSRFAFVYGGLKTKRYYWEFINLLRKTLLIIIFVFLNLISVHTQAFVTFLVIFFFGFAHVRHYPYQDQRLNRLELFSLITLGVMNYSGMFFLSQGSTDFTTYFLLIIAIICNIVFFFLTAIYFIQSYRYAAKQIVRKVSFKISRSLSRIDSKKYIDSDFSAYVEKQNNSPTDTHNICQIFTQVNNQPNQNPNEAISPRIDVDTSCIPSEEGTDRSDRKTIYAQRKEEANYSIMKNSGYSYANLRRKSSGSNQAGSQIGLQSFGNSSIFSPKDNQRISFLNTERFFKPMNTIESHQEDNMETPPPSSNDRLRSEFDDFPMLTVPQSAMKLDELLASKSRQKPHGEENGNEEK